MSEELELSVHDNVTTFEPDFDVGMSIAGGVARYWILERSEQFTPNEKGGQTRTVAERKLEVTADVWRDAAKLLRVAELRQMREVIKEALDADVNGTFAAELRRIADHTLDD
jgi:hypothetical protein